jgi:hypothetical protein
MNRFRYYIEWQVFGVCTQSVKDWVLLPPYPYLVCLYLLFNHGIAIDRVFYPRFWMNMKRYILSFRPESTKISMIIVSCEWDTLRFEKYIFWIVYLMRFWHILPFHMRVPICFCRIGIECKIELLSIITAFSYNNIGIPALPTCWLIFVGRLKQLKRR